MEGERACLSVEGRGTRQAMAVRQVPSEPMPSSVRWAATPSLGSKLRRIKGALGLLADAQRAHPSGSRQRPKVGSSSCASPRRQ